MVAPATTAAATTITAAAAEHRSPSGRRRRRPLHRGFGDFAGGKMLKIRGTKGAGNASKGVRRREDSEVQKKLINFLQFETIWHYKFTETCGTM